MSFISRNYVRDAKGQQCCPFFRSELECEENIMLVSRVKREKPPCSQRQLGSMVVGSFCIALAGGMRTTYHSI